MKATNTLLIALLCCNTVSASSIEHCDETHQSVARIIATESCRILPAGEAKAVCFRMQYRQALAAQCVPRPLIDFPWINLPSRNNGDNS